MKKILLNLAMSTFVVLSVAACGTPNTANGTNPSSSASPGTSTGTNGGNSLATKASFIAYLNCVKVKSPSASAAIDLYINNLNLINDAQWAAVSASYESFGKAYAALGCN